MSRSRDIANLLGSSSPIVDKTIIDAKGDLLIGSADNTVTKLAAGSTGQLPLVDSSTSSGLRYVDPPTNRNLVINGAMQVAQRGTSKASITANGHYTADRFAIGLSSLGTWTQTVEDDGPIGSGFTKSFKMLCTTAKASPAATDYLTFEHFIEGQNVQQVRKGTSNSKQLTLSFWVKSNVTGTYVVTLYDGDNNRQVSAQYSVNASATWEQKTVTYPADTTGTFANSNGASLQIYFGLGAGSNRTSGTLQSTWTTFAQANFLVGQTNLAAATNNYWQITGVQLEVGPVATPFEFEPYEATLRKCQRYYARYDVTTSITVGFGAAYSTTAAEISIPARPQMRITPTSIDYANLQLTDQLSNTNATSAALAARSGRDLLSIAVTVAGGLTTNRPYWLRGSSDGYIAFSAEL